MSQWTGIRPLSPSLPAWSHRNRINYVHIGSNQRSRQPGIVCSVGWRTCSTLTCRGLFPYDRRTCSAIGHCLDFKFRRNRGTIRIRQECFYHTHYDGEVELTMALMLQVHRVVVVVVLVVTMILSQWCSLSEALLNPVEAAALFDLCDRTGTDLWTNCSDSANACIHSANWPGITCDATNTSIINMYD